MKVAVIGSRTLAIKNMKEYLPDGTDEIVSGGAKGIDACAREYAQKEGIRLTEFFPDYRRYGKGAPLRRNLEIIKYADAVVVLWDGCSRGTAFVIEQCEKNKKTMKVYIIT